MERAESTSRASSSNSESALTSESCTNVTSDIASMLVSVTLGQAADNLNELMQRISMWEAEGNSDTADSEGRRSSHTQQKVEQYLRIFFNVRRVFAEHRGDETEDIPEDLQYFSISHPKTNVTDEEGLDVAEGSEIRDSTLHESSPTASLNLFQAVETCDVMSPVMEEDLVTDMEEDLVTDMEEDLVTDMEEELVTDMEEELVTDMDSTPAPSGQDECVDEVIGSSSSGSYLKISLNANEKSQPRTDKKISQGLKCAWQFLSLIRPKTKVADGSESDSTCDSTLRGSSPTASLSSFQVVEHCDVMSPIMEEDLVTGMDSTPAPSGQDEHLELSEVHVDEAAGSSSSGSYSPKSVKANKKSARRIGKKVINGFKRAWRFLSFRRPKIHVTDEQGLDVDDGSESYQTRDSTLHESSTTASLQAAEDCDVMSPVTEEELVTDNVETASNNLTSSCASLRELCNTFSMEAPSQEKDAALEPSTNSSCPPPENPRRSPVEDRNQNMASTSGHSTQDRHLEDSQEDKSATYVIYKGFIDSLTKEQQMELSRGVYSMEVQKKMFENFAKALLKGFEAELSASLPGSASQNGSLLAKLSKDLDTTDKLMKQILNENETPEGIEDTQRSQVKSILSETSDQRQTPPETKTTGNNVPYDQLSWWTIFTKKNINPPPYVRNSTSNLARVPLGDQGSASGRVGPAPRREAWTEEKHGKTQNKSARTKEASLLKRLKCGFSLKCCCGH